VPSTRFAPLAYLSRRGGDISRLSTRPYWGACPRREAGTLLVFVGGERGSYESCRPIFEAISNASFFMGPSGAGATMKFVVTDLLGVGMQALVEALTLGQRAGLDKDLLIDVLQQTSVLTAGQKAKLQNARNDAYPIHFALRLMWKDFGNVMRLAQEYQVPRPATAAAHQISTIAQTRGVDEGPSPDNEGTGWAAPGAIRAAAADRAG
jgi:3-hydroxyisobutyrate dehydrogenase